MLGRMRCRYEKGDVDVLHWEYAYLYWLDVHARNGKTLDGLVVIREVLTAHVIDEVSYRFDEREWLRVLNGAGTLGWQVDDLHPRFENHTYPSWMAELCHKHVGPNSEVRDYHYWSMRRCQ